MLIDNISYFFHFSGQSTHRVDFRKILASAVAMFLINWMQFFPMYTDFGHLL